MSTLFSGDYLRNRPTLDIGVLSYIGIVQHKEHSRSFVHSSWDTLYIMGLSNNPICRKYGTEEETSVHVLCECEALASLRHSHMGSFILETENIGKLSMGVIWNFAKVTGLLLVQNIGHKGPV